MYTKILGTGSYLPKKILTNFDLEKMVETNNDWIIERTGIHERRIAASDETAATMAEEAAKNAMLAAGISPKDLDMIIVATTTPEKVFPSTACLLQHRFNISGCPGFDLNSAACSGFIYGLSIADQFIKNGNAKNVLLVGSEVMSRIVDWSDRTTCILFGDGAGAVVLGPSDTPGIMCTRLHADGNHKDILSLDMPTEQTKEFIKMTGNSVFKLAVNMLGDLFDETLEAAKLKKSDIHWLVPHQANIRIIQSMAKKLELPMERVTITLDKQGNTSSASIPLALDQAVRAGQIKRGEVLMLEAFGGGLAWGSALLKF